MYKELKDLIVRYEELGLYPDEYFVREAIYIISRGLDVDDVVDDVIFELPKAALYGTLASYQPNNKSIAISLDYRKDVDLYFNCYYKDKYEDKSKVLAQNLFFINVLFHELDHASFFKELDEGKDDITHRLWKVIDPSFLEDKMDSKVGIVKTLGYLFKLLYSYARYHDYAPHEVRAIVSAAERTNILTKELYDSNLRDNDIKFYDSVFEFMSDYELLRRYHNKRKHIYNGPAYDFCNKLSYNKDLFPDELKLYNKNRIESFKEDSSKYSLADRIMQGLQINDEEYNYILNKSCLLEHIDQFKSLKKRHK